MAATFKEIWDTLTAVDTTSMTEDKMGMTYLSWSWAWQALMEHYPDAQYEFDEPVWYPSMFAEKRTAEVRCTVTIEGHQRTMWLPVMDNKMQAKSNPDTRDISDAKMRCLVKCLAVFGLGVYIYARDDLPRLSKDKARPIFSKLTDELEDKGTYTELKNWATEKVRDIKSLPRDWEADIRDAYSTRMDVIKKDGGY